MQIAAAVVPAVQCGGFFTSVPLRYRHLAADVGVCEEIPGHQCRHDGADTVNAAILQPCVTLFAPPCLHDAGRPREVGAGAH